MQTFRERNDIDMQKQHKDTLYKDTHALDRDSPRTNTHINSSRLSTDYLFHVHILNADNLSGGSLFVGRERKT